MAPNYDSLPCGVLSFGDDGRILEVNATLCTLLGYSRQEGLAGLFIHSLFPPGGRVFYETHIFPLLKLQGEVEEIYFSLQTKEGESVPFLLNGRRIIDENGSPKSECVLVRMRQRMHFENELLQGKKTAQDASRAKDEFLAKLSHELRTPLSPVLMVATAMELDLELPPEVRTDAAIIRQNAELEVRLIDDLLDHTRIANRKVNLVLETLDAHALLKNTAEIVRADAARKPVAISFDCQAPESYVHCDGARLQQVFWNVIKNAVKFFLSGGEVRVRTSNDQTRRLIVQVADSGIGVEKEYLSRIFNPFDQGSIAKSQYGGLGLGLAIARGVVELHGGTVWADSEGLGRGTTIGIGLPTAPRPMEKDLPPAPSPFVGETMLRLMLVEDHESTRDVLCRILRKSGHNVQAAGNVAEAVALAAEIGPIDVLLTDLGLPDQSGYELLAAIRPSQPHMVAVALTGYGMEEDVKRAKAAGFAAHFVKPVPFEQLRSFLDQVRSQRVHAKPKDE